VLVMCYACYDSHGIWADVYDLWAMDRYGWDDLRFVDLSTLGSLPPF